MNQIMFLKFKSYSHIPLFIWKIYYWGVLICGFLIKTWRNCVIYLNWIISLKTKYVSKSQTTRVLKNFYTNKNATFFNSSSVETGISDHHILVCTMLCSIFCKGLAKFIYYRSYKKYNKEQFEKFLNKRLVSSSNFEQFFDVFLATLNEHAPLKKNIR